MLIAAELDTELWAEAVNTSVYLLNRHPRELDEQIPYELWTNRKVMLDHLRKFGATVYTHIPKQFRSKFETKSKKMIFVGYDGNSINYRVYNSETSKVTVTRDIVFEEREVHSCQARKYTGIHFSNEYTQENDDNIEKEVTTDVQEPQSLSEEMNEEETQPTTANTEDQQSLRNRDTIRPPARYINDCNVACPAVVMEAPQSYQEAVSGTDGNNWKQAMAEEMESLYANGTWSLVPKPTNHKIIDSKWVYKIKRRINGSIERYKARLCAKGFLQIKGIDFNDTFSPVVRYDSIRLLLALAIINTMNIQQFDVNTAFLHGSLDEEVFMRQPEGYCKDPNLFSQSFKKELADRRV